MWMNTDCKTGPKLCQAPRDASEHLKQHETAADFTFQLITFWDTVFRAVCFVVDQTIWLISVHFILRCTKLSDRVLAESLMKAEHFKISIIFSPFPPYNFAYK